ncbi:SAYSvFN domain-containing protein 1-like [Clinocottus analis]|uniref:SAYSvFN domain-containing protein 1-like n=1 Tax=Clinocottus analis TaxID=304258 RepID=UPI0035C07699
MEQNLAEFRARRQAEHTGEKDDSARPQCIAQTIEDTAAQTDKTKTTDSQQTKETENISALSQTSPIKEHSDRAVGRWLTSRQFFFSNLTLLKVLLWLVLLGLFAEIEFGLPFFVISLFYWLYEGLRSPADRKPGELSAYSVFNPDCQPLLGTLTPEQLEGEMGYRPLATRSIAHLY